MNINRLFITAGAIFLFALLWNGFVHLVILADANSALATITRPAAERSLGLSLFITAALALLFVWSFARFARQGNMKEGLLLGIFFALLAGILADLNQYVMYPIPASLAAKWFGFGLIEFCGYGVLAAWLYPTKART
ncbi:hypothetical protein EDS67_26980 [candidate division KSB1 bacterium]|nr:MAG: hypothetical protein EDS67_26980 [candidate division KSB1 bacterium]MBC6950364.1 hypothetical protein [candidate division KSB1 bacterium]MCE7944948.1 hypothetical protein [Chlorobi bacterium CHB1]MDL1877756.1 hypothetical protein [Cytophagia bacterium CHB2]